MRGYACEPDCPKCNETPPVPAGRLCRVEGCNLTARDHSSRCWIHIGGDAA